MCMRMLPLAMLPYAHGIVKINTDDNNRDHKLMCCIFTQCQNLSENDLTQRSVIQPCKQDTSAVATYLTVATHFPHMHDSAGNWGLAG